MRLEPLASDATAALLEQLPGGDALPGGLRSRILDAAEGNRCTWKRCSGCWWMKDVSLSARGAGRLDGEIDRIEIPMSVRALLASRIDALPHSERGVAKRASVAGRVFDAAAVRELTIDAMAEVGQSLLGLVRKELVRPERSQLTAGDAFKFRHILIRDAAYDALAKSERADLHEHFGDWLERISGERAEEYQEVIGYHFEQAHRYRAELGAQEGLPALAERAANMLGYAGRRAFARRDVRTTVDLLECADALWPRESSERLRSIPNLADALVEVGESERAMQLLKEGLALAETVGDPGLRAYLALAYRGQSEDSTWPDLAERGRNRCAPHVRTLAGRGGDSPCLGHARQRSLGADAGHRCVRCLGARCRAQLERR